MDDVERSNEKERLHYIWLAILSCDEVDVNKWAIKKIASDDVDLAILSNHTSNKRNYWKMLNHNLL